MWVDRRNFNYGQLKRTLFFLIVGGRHAWSVSSLNQRRNSLIFHTLSVSDVTFCTSSSQMVLRQAEQLTNQIVKVYKTRDFFHKWREKTAGKQRALQIER